MSFDDIIRFRCEGDLKRRFEAIAALERRDPADLARIVFEDFVASKETLTLKDAPPAGHKKTDASVSSGQKVAAAVVSTNISTYRKKPAGQRRKTQK